MNESRLPLRKYEIRATPILTDHETADLFKTTLEAVGTALFTPERVDASAWLHLVMVAALADAALHKNRGTDPVAVATR